MSDTTEAPVTEEPTESTVEPVDGPTEDAETDPVVVGPTEDAETDSSVDGPTEDDAVVGDPEADTPAPVPVVTENYLSEEEKAIQEAQETQAAALEPGQTLPWVAEPPSGVAEERAIEAATAAEEAEDSFPADEDAEGTGSEVDSSRHETVENPPDTEESEDTETRST